MELKKVAQMVKNLPAMQEPRVQSLSGIEEDPKWDLSGEDHLEKGMSSTPVFLPGESHGQMSLVSYSLWGGKESDTTGQLTLFTFTRSGITEVILTILIQGQWMNPVLTFNARSHRLYKYI